MPESIQQKITRLTINAALEIIYPGAGRYDWPTLARPDQRAPAGQDWTSWLLLGGRGAGKTRAGAEWIRLVADRPGQDEAARIALVAESYADAREVMIEGPSGLRAISPAHQRPDYVAARRRLIWPNGATAYCFSAEDPEGLRGYQFHAAWSDEICKWRYPEETWSNLQLALRLGERPQQVVTTTPRPMTLLKRLLSDPQTVLSQASSYANRENLSPAFFSEIASAYEGTALGRQELLGELIEDIQGALWNWSMIEAARISAAPDLERVVVAVDPPVSIGPQADECGIIIAGVAQAGAERCGFVLADRTCQGLSPQGWAERVVAAYEEFDADRVVVEVNQGGELVRSVLAQASPGLPIKSVRAVSGKRLRAEPIAALYEQGRVRHVGSFALLEDQMTSYLGAGDASPDRLDALVWALTDLMLSKRGPQPSLRRIN